MVSLAKNEFHYTVDQISRRDKCDRATAMYKARREDPEGFAHAFGLDPADLPVAKSVASKDKENWELEVEGEKMRTKCSHGEAARRVARNRPDLRIGKGVTPRTNDLAGMRGADPTMADGTAKRDWMFAVAKIQDRDSCTYTEAMSKARKEYPSEFAAFQGIGGQQTRGGTV